MLYLRVDQIWHTVDIVSLPEQHRGSFNRELIFLYNPPKYSTQINIHQPVI